MITHLGESLMNGHFIAHFRHIITDMQLCYNDSTVTLCQDQENDFRKKIPYTLKFNFILDEIVNNDYGMIYNNQNNININNNIFNNNTFNNNFNINNNSSFNNINFNNNFNINNNNKQNMFMNSLNDQNSLISNNNMINNGSFNMNNNIPFI